MSAAGVATREGAGFRAGPRRVAHLELHTRDQATASAFYERLLDWPAERIDTRYGSYLALGSPGGVDAGIVECGTTRALWLPYVEVERIEHATRRARELGASVLLESCEGPAGWRSVVEAPDGSEMALWQPKEWR